MKKLKTKVKLYPMIPYAFVFSMQLLTYYFSKLINADFNFYDFTLHFDRLVPFVPASIIIYVLCYAWWFISPFLIAAHTDKKRFYEFVATSVICFIICFVLFITIPTTIVRPTFEVNDFFTWATAFIYSTDIPNNLFPSMHCLVSWLCFMSFRGFKNTPKPLLWFQCIFALLVCISTQTIKQHYIVDFFSAIALAEIVFLLVRKLNLGKAPNKFFTAINIRLRLERKETEIKSDNQS